MEFPSFNHHNHHHHHHHHNRYVPPPPPPSPKPNLYPHHHHHLLPPPPLPPLSYPSLPPPPPPPPLPPPPPPPHQSNFTFLDSQNPSFFNHNRSSPPRFSNRFDYRPDSWSDPPRVLPEPPHSHRILPHHPPPLYAPYPQSETYYNPNDLQRVIIPSSRHRDDIANDGYASRDSGNVVQHVFRGSRKDDDNGGDNYLRHRYPSSHSEGFSRDLDKRKVTSSSSRNLEEFVKKYESRYPSILENERSWDRHVDEDSRWAHSMKGENNRGGGDDGVSFVSAREQSRGFDYDSSKFNRDREGREEFKQIQKKSVLLRIGKPNNSYRNRSHDLYFSKAYMDDSSNSNFRGKDKDKGKDHRDKDFGLHLDQKMEVDRDGSPVELDVSFKSNALVAKAVVTSSSPGFDNKHTQPRNRKIRRTTEFDSPLAKPGSRSESSSHGSECPSTSEKAPKQLRDQESVNDGVSMGDFGSLSGAVSGQGGSSGGSDGPLSFRLRKRRKVINLKSQALIFQLTEKDDKPVNGESPEINPTAPIQGVISFPSLEELSVTEVDESQQATISEKDRSEFDTIRLSQCDNVKSVATSSSPLADKKNPSPPNTDTFGRDLAADDNRTTPKISTASADVVDDLNRHPCQNEVPLFLENDTQKEATDDKVLVGDGGISASSGCEEIHKKGVTDPYTKFDTADNCYSSFNASIRRQASSNLADTNSLGPCLNEIIMALPESGDVQVSLNDVSAKEEETKLLEGTARTASIPNNSLTTAQVKKIISESCVVDDTNKQTCFDFPEDGSKESPNTIVIAEDNPLVDSGKSYTLVAKQKRNRETQFNLSSPRETPENLVDPVLDVDATSSSSLKDGSFGEDEVTEMGKLTCASVQTPSLDHRKLSTDDKNYLVCKDDLPPSSSILSAFAGSIGVISNDKSAESMPDTLTNIVSSKKSSSFSGSCMLTSKSTAHVVSNQNISRADNVCETSVSKGGALFNCSESLAENPRTSMETNDLEVTDLLANSKTASSVSQGSSVKHPSLNTKVHGSNFPMKEQSPASAVPRVFTGRSSPVFTNSRINTPANHIAKRRTWHRSTSNPASSVTKSSSIPVPPPPKRVGMGQNSYVRSGNTLVRKGAPVTAISSGSPASRSSVYQLNSSGPNEIRDSAGSGRKIHNTYSRTGVVRPKTPPLSASTKLLECIEIHSGDSPSSPLEHVPMNVSSEEASAPFVENLAAPIISEDYKFSGTPEDQTGTPSNSESQKTPDEGASGKKMRYVKLKSNQLVAASSTDQSIQDLDKTNALSSDGYYKRRKNQLIRTSVGDDTLNTEVQRASEINLKQEAGKGTSKKYKHSRFSSVWTLNSQLSGKDGVALRHKVKPHLFPWKRTRHWGNMNGSASIPSNSSSSLISRKLLLSRKRDIIYTRSSRGFSLRMSKLLSVGASSLKWSKSIERNSKKANKEATLAVAAVEKKKRERHGTVCATGEIKSRNNMSRDRIFRIGLVRYKMDPSRRTLQRISDEEPSTSMQSKEEIKRPYIPKRLLIGHEEYVRIGSGNQLVRNPKKRTRIFANEKVRWSLHTARSRLAKKRKYCQFYTRFGKCNKGDGKCPYVHDSSKIAVCTKFLSGSCSNPECKLTHKIIPERMQDCSYFLQGLCSNEHCPYRHVNVNSAASICEGFLKGYCADGNECRKKHSYVCPIFEATGACPQGTKCKLHHPKNRNMGLKRKQNPTKQHQKNARGRYFGSITVAEVGDCAIPFSKNRSLKDNDDVFCQEGKFAEYINLDISNEESGDACEVTSEQRTTLSDDPSDVGVADLDELMKPVRLMNKIVVLESVHGFDSLSERTASSFSEDTVDRCKVGQNIGES